jgi:hypothetical protein
MPGEYLPGAGTDSRRVRNSTISSPPLAVRGEWEHFFKWERMSELVLRRQCIKGILVRLGRTWYRMVAIWCAGRTPPTQRPAWSQSFVSYLRLGWSHLDN